MVADGIPGGVWDDCDTRRSSLVSGAVLFGGSKRTVNAP